MALKRKASSAYLSWAVVKMISKDGGPICLSNSKAVVSLIRISRNTRSGLRSLMARSPSAAVVQASISSMVSGYPSCSRSRSRRMQWISSSMMIVRIISESQLEGQPDLDPCSMVETRDFHPCMLLFCFVENMDTGSGDLATERFPARCDLCCLCQDTGAIVLHTAKDGLGFLADI